MLSTWSKTILILTGVIAVLQITHLFLLNYLDTIIIRKSKVVKPNNLPPEVEAEFVLKRLEKSLKNSKLDSTREYKIVTLHETQALVPTPDVSLVTQCSYNHIPKLIDLSRRWMGRVSVAVFVEEAVLGLTLHKIASLISCYPEIKSNVTFSLVSPVQASSGQPLIPEDGSGCDFGHDDPNFENYASFDDYPNNLLRNVARRASSTEFIFVVDIDFVPNENLRQDFVLYATQKGLFKRNRQYDKTLFVVPAFEASPSVEPPLNKAQLLSLVDTGEVRQFYVVPCSKCHAPTNYEIWLNEPSGAELAPLFEVNWKQPWEPFYIANNNVPLYDERFKRYGYNRMSQLCELHVAGYTFSVLNNAFLVHRGFKTMTFHADKDDDLNSNRLLFRQFKSELKYKYIESSRRCV